MRKDMDAINTDHEEAIVTVRNKFNQQLAHLQEEMEALRKTKSRYEMAYSYP